MKQYSKILALLFWAILIGKNSNACTCIGFLTIDSLPQLKEYDFIAHVRIMADQDFKKPAKDDYETIGQLNFQIIELFKGEKIEQLLEYSKNSSCDLGITIGEEWILFGKRINGRIAVVACDRNHQYKAMNGLRDWKYGSGFYELRQLRKLYGHPVKIFGTEEHKEFYINGQPEIEERYNNGKLDGERKIWYPNGQLFCRQFYINDSLDGRSEWFYPTGQLYEEEYYLKGKLSNVGRLYFDSSIHLGWKNLLINRFYKTEDSLTFVYKRIQTQYERVYDLDGRIIILREYTRLGKICKEETIDPDKRYRVVIYYHENGMMSSIMYSLNGKNYGHYQTYDEKGRLSRGWDYDEEGKAINIK